MISTPSDLPVRSGKTAMVATTATAIAATFMTKFILTFLKDVQIFI